MWLRCRVCERTLLVLEEVVRVPFVCGRCGDENPRLGSRLQLEPVSFDPLKEPVEGVEMVRDRLLAGMAIDVTFREAP